MFGLKRFSIGFRPFVITSVSQLPSLEIQFDASQLPTLNGGTISSGNEVTTWGNGGGLASKDWNSTGGRRPEWFSNIQNGRGVVRFNNAGSTPTGEDADNNEILSINPISYLQSLSGSTLVLVYRSLSTAAGRRIITSTNTNGFQFGQNGTQYVGGFSGATFTIDNKTVDTNFHKLILVFDGSKTGNANRLKARLDGSDVTLTISGTVNATTNASASSFYGGTDADGNSNFFIGDIGECLIWTKALASSEITALEQFLSNKWRI